MIEQLKQNLFFYRGYLDFSKLMNHYLNFNFFYKKIKNIGRMHGLALIYFSFRSLAWLLWHCLHGNPNCRKSNVLLSHSDYQNIQRLINQLHTKKVGKKRKTEKWCRSLKRYQQLEREHNKCIKIINEQKAPEAIFFRGNCHITSHWTGSDVRIIQLSAKGVKVRDLLFPSKRQEVLGTKSSKNRENTTFAAQMHNWELRKRCTQKTNVLYLLKQSKW